MPPLTAARCPALLGALLLIGPVRAQQAADTTAECVAAALHTAEYADPVGVRAEALKEFLSYDSGPSRSSRVWPSAVVIRDSVAAALRADLRPDLLLAALDHLEGPAHRRLYARARANAPTLERAERKTTRRPRPTFADSALVERYAEATEPAPRLAALMTRSLKAMVTALALEGARVPVDSVALFQELDDQLASGDDELADEQAGIQRDAARVALAGVAVADVEAEIAFYESPAGRYVAAAQDAALAAALTPVVDCWIGRIVRQDPSCRW